MRIPWRLGTVTVGAAALVAALGVGVANAAESKYDGTNPMSTVWGTPCNVGAVTIDIAYIWGEKTISTGATVNYVVANVDLRYNKTCRAAWAKVTLLDPSRYRFDQAQIFRHDGHYYYDRYHSSDGTLYWTPMVDDANKQSQAWGTVVEVATGHDITEVTTWY